MLKLAVSGAHSTGKTQLLHQMEGLLTMKRVACCIVPEVARGCPFPIGLKLTSSAALWLVLTGIAREVEANRKAQVILVDRPVVDTWAYLCVSQPQLRSDPDHFEISVLRELIKLWVPTYHIIIETVLDHCDAITNDNFRDVSPDYRADVVMAISEANEFFGVRSYKVSRNQMTQVLEAVAKEITEMIRVSGY